MSVEVEVEVEVVSVDEVEPVGGADVGGEVAGAAVPYVYASIVIVAWISGNRRRPSPNQSESTVNRRPVASRVPLRTSTRLRSR